MYYKSYEIPVFNSRHMELDIGTQYEDGVRELLLDLSKWKEAYGEGSATILYMQDGDEYAVARESVLDGNILHWLIKKADTTAVSGTVVIRYTPFDGGEARSIRLRTTARKSIPVQDGEIPEQDTGWYESILSACDNIMAVKAEMDDLRTDAIDAIENAVSKYFGENPVIETDPTVPAWAKEPEKPSYTAAEVGAVDADDLQAATEEALRIAKASGQFDGKDGDKGDPGETIYIENPYDDSELKRNLTRLDSTKVGYSEVVGGQLLMYSDSTKEHLLATLDLPGGGVNDVKVDGASVVQDGVANFKIASVSDLGLVKGNPYYGFSVDQREGSSGNVSAATPNISKYKTLSNNYFISKGTLDNVLATPSIMPALAPEEQLAGRQRLGLEAVDAPVGGVTDVQRADNAQSFVVDGVAKIPLGNSTTPGLMRTISAYGLQTWGDGILGLARSTNSDINKRTQNDIKPVSLGYLDYAVKAAMTAPIADTAGQIDGVFHYPAWKAKEQAAARERIGLDSVIIESGLMHPEESAKIFSFNFADLIPDGYIVSRIMILYEAPTGVNETGNANVTTSSTHGIVGFIASNVFSQTANRFILMDIYDGFNGFVFCDAAGGSGNNTSGNQLVRQYQRTGSIAGCVSLNINFNFNPKSDNNIYIRIVLRQFKEE